MAGAMSVPRRSGRGERLRANIARLLERVRTGKAGAGAAISSAAACGVGKVICGMSIWRTSERPEGEAAAPTPNQETAMNPLHLGYAAGVVDDDYRAQGQWDMNDFAANVFRLPQLLGV